MALPNIEMPLNPKPSIKQMSAKLFEPGRMTGT